MAIFSKAVLVVFDHEGGYVNDSDDPGGETRYGISKRSYPEVDIAALTEQGAASIYYRDYWRPQRLEEFTDQDVATKVLDFSVLMGLRPGALCLQRALRATGHEVTEDGIIGPQTINAANTKDPKALLAALRSEGAGRLRCIAGRRDSLKKFERGWLRRAYS